MISSAGFSNLSPSLFSLGERFTVYRLLVNMDHFFVEIGPLWEERVKCSCTSCVSLSDP